MKNIQTCVTIAVIINFKVYVELGGLTMRKLSFIGWLLAISLLLSACLGGMVKPNFQAFAYEIEEDYVLILYNVTKEEYEEIKDKNLEELMDLGHFLLQLDYSGKKDFEEDDQISVWIDGDIEDSYPQKGKAANLELFIE